MLTEPRFPSYKSQPRGIIEICENVMDMCIGGREVWTPVFSDEKMLAFQHHGIIFAQSAAFYQTLNFECCFVHLVAGAIIADGEERMKLYTYSRHQQKTESMTCSDFQLNKPFAPVNWFPGICFCTRLKVDRESIYLQQDALVQGQICAIPSPGISSRTLAGLYVTEDCDHRYYDTVTVDEIVERENEEMLKQEKISLLPGAEVDRRSEERLKIKQGFFRPGAELDSSILELWLQAVDQDGPGQWLAYQDSGTAKYLTLIQRNCCIKCACKRLVAGYQFINLPGFPSSLFSPGLVPRCARIIYGRLAGEDME